MQLLVLFPVSHCKEGGRESEHSWWRSHWYAVGRINKMLNVSVCVANICICVTLSEAEWRPVYCLQ